MLIMSQGRKSLLNLENASELFLSSAYGDYNGGPVKVLATFPLVEDVTTNLGEYESEARGAEVLEEIARLYEKCNKTISKTGSASALAFAFTPPKVYRMPEA